MNIRNKSIISIINNREVLLTEGCDPIRDFRFYVPVGGGVEFGESIQAAAEREMREELGLSGQTLDFVNFHESIFQFLGQTEHEIVFHFVCHISNESRANLPTHVIESSGERVEFFWYSRTELERIKLGVVPPQIYDELFDALASQK